MNKVARFLTDLAAGFSVTTWISGPLFEEYGLKAALKAAVSPQEKKALARAYEPYKAVARSGLVGLVLTDVVKFLTDDLRRKGTPAYKRWATVGDLLVVASVTSSVVTTQLSGKLEAAPRASDEAEKTKRYLALAHQSSIWLSVGLLGVSAVQYQERVKSNLR